MPNWKKLIVSGSDAVLNTVTALSFTGSLKGIAESASYVSGSNVHGFELTELHDVLTSASQSGDLLMLSSSVWINSKNLTGSYGISGSLTVTGSVSISGILENKTYFAQGKLAADQGISSSVDTVIPFVDDVDLYGWWDAGTKKFTPTVAGYYQIGMGVWYEDIGSTSAQMNCQMRKNGNTFGIAQEPNNSSGTGQSLTVTKFVYLNGSTDYVDFATYHSATGIKTIQAGSNGAGTWFTALYVSA